MDYGLVNARFHWQRNMDDVMDEDRSAKGSQWPARDKWAIINVDDILIWSMDIEGYRIANKDVLDRLAKKNIWITWHKSQWALPKVNFCGQLSLVKI